MWGPWQVGQMTATEYAHKATQWAKALKLLDPSLCLILCGQEGLSTWDYTVLSQCIKFVDMHSIHMYVASPNHPQNALAPLAAERAIETTAAMIDVARIENRVSPKVAQTTICFDEWNMWDPIRAPGEEGGEESYTLSDALGVAVWLNVFVRQSRWVGMANIAQTVNVISPLMTTKDGIMKQTTWWPLLLYSKYMRGYTIGVHMRGSAYDGETYPPWLQGTLAEGASWLDISACVSESGTVTLAVVNVSETKDFETDLLGVGSDVKVFTVTGSNIKVINTDGKEEVGIQEGTWDGKGKYKFGKHSLTMLRWETGEKPTTFKKVEEANDMRKMVSTANDWS
jgi:alpha-N-arabinofuranosidase